MKRSWFVALGLMASLATAAQATVPSTLSYQGVLTDNVGNIQPDGLYNFVFKIYTVGSGGSAIWTETDNNVQLTKGSFTVLLGNATTLSTLAFDVPYYVGISVNGQPELTPRVQLASSAYGLSLRLPFSGVDTSSGPLFTIRNTSGGFDIAADHSMLVGATNAGYLNLGAPGASAGLASLYSYGALATAPTQTGVAGFGGALDLYDFFGDVTTTIEPDVNGLGAGYFNVSGNTGGNRFTVDGNSDDAGSPRVLIVGSASSMSFDTGASGDPSVNLPNSSVDAAEILDEPGISQGKFATSFNFSNTGSMADIVTTSITIPAPGYVVLTAHAQAGLTGTTLSNYIIAQIDDTAGGVEDASHSEYVGGASFPTTGTFYIPYSNTRTYFESVPGTYTFRLEAQKGSANGTCYFYNPTITAEYFPTGYGSVTALVSATDASRFAAPQTVARVGQDGRAGAPSAMVDLHELELQVALEQSRLAQTRARLEAARHARQVQGSNLQRHSAAKPAGGGN